jgi:putative colanic acid biosynthesis acetyltransferase WcaF
MGVESGIGNGVECYNVTAVILGDHVVVSQRAHLCTASHDFNELDFPLVGAPIVLGAGSWVAAEAFVGPGVTFGEGAVALARAVVTRDAPAWSVLAGNPAKVIRLRARCDESLSTMSALHYVR